MQITLTMDLTEENLEKLKTFLDKKPVAVGVKAEEPKREEPTKENVPGAPVITMTDVRAKALAMSKAGKAAELKAIFAKFGAVKLSDIKPEDYEALMRELVNANA